MGHEKDVILIHGTFASESTWTQNDSYLARELSSQIGKCEFFDFPWDGANSHKARLRAGAKLAAMIRARAAQYPERDRIVIAHSHGGNVVLYALKHDFDSRLISRCVFLGTPFIHCRPRRVFPVLSILSALGLIAIILIVCIVFDILLEIYLGVGSFPVLSVEAIVVMILLSRVLRFRTNLLRAAERIKRRALAYIQPAKLQVKSLVCFTKYDEAGIWLGASGFAASLPFVVSFWITRLSRQFSFGVGLAGLGFFAAVIARRVIGTQNFPYEAVLLGSIAIFCFSLMAMGALIVAQPAHFVIPAIFRSHRFSFGYDGILTYALVHVWTDPLPQGASAEQVFARRFSFPRPKGSLRHSAFYQNSACVQVIADWLLDRSMVEALQSDDPPKVKLPHQDADWTAKALYLSIWLLVMTYVQIFDPTSFLDR